MLVLGPMSTQLQYRMRALSSPMMVIVTARERGQKKERGAGRETELDLEREKGRRTRLSSPYLTTTIITSVLSSS